MLNKENLSTYLKLMFIVIFTVLILMIVKSCNENSIYEKGKDAGKNEQVIDQQEQNARDDKKREEVKDVIVEEQVKTIVDVHKQEVKKREEVREQQKKTEEKVEKIEQNLSIPEPEKDRLIAEVQIDDLWESYCSTAGAVCETNIGG